MQAMLELAAFCVLREARVEQELLNVRVGGRRGWVVPQCFSIFFTT